MSIDYRNACSKGFSVNSFEGNFDVAEIDITATDYDADEHSILGSQSFNRLVDAVSQIGSSFLSIFPCCITLLTTVIQY